jgi:hypothetical protein
MPFPTSWLFVRGHESVWIYRSQSASLSVYGPGPDRIRCDFGDARGLEVYLADVILALQEAGWHALGEGYERRTSKRDRRRLPRGTPERRHADTQRRTEPVT